MAKRKRQKDAVGNRGSRKLGRNSAKCKVYRLHDKRSKNKARRAARIRRGFQKRVTMEV